jgi:hypothetical protein
MQSVARCPQRCVPRHGCTVERFIFIPSRAVARYKRRCDNDQAPRPLSTVIVGSSQYLLSQGCYCPINACGQTTARVRSTDAPERALKAHTGGFKTIPADLSCDVQLEEEIELYSSSRFHPSGLSLNLNPREIEREIYIEGERGGRRDFVCCCCVWRDFVAQCMVGNEAVDCPVDSWRRVSRLGQRESRWAVNTYKRCKVIIAIQVQQ